MAELLHVTDVAAWAEAQRAGRCDPPPGGFIHLCSPEQLAYVLERHFHGRTGLLILHLDPAGLDVRWEDSEPGMASFPHLYQALPAGAVTRVEPV